MRRPLGQQAFCPAETVRGRRARSHVSRQRLVRLWGKPQRRAFEWAIDWMTRIDPCSGLLLSKHRTGLQRGRYGKMTSPKAFNTQNLPEDNEDFLERNEEE